MKKLEYTSSVFEFINSGGESLSPKGMKGEPKLKEFRMSQLTPEIEKMAERACAQGGVRIRTQHKSPIYAWEFEAEIGAKPARGA